MRRFIMTLSLLFLIAQGSLGQSSQNFRIRADVFDSGSLGLSNPGSTNFLNSAIIGQSSGLLSSLSQNFKVSSGAARAFYAFTLPTDVEDSPLLPTKYSLDQNYPNPFNPTTIITYALPRQSRVTLSIYDLLGRVVETLVEDTQEAGIYKVPFDASRFTSGVYFYRIRAGTFVATKKLLLLR